MKMEYDFHFDILSFFENKKISEVFFIGNFILQENEMSPNGMIELQKRYVVEGKDFFSVANRHYQKK